MDTKAVLDIEALCTRTVNRYAIAVGERDYDTFAKLFTEDGVWQRPGSAAMHGREQIRAFMEGLPASTLVRHVNGTIRVDVIDETAARGISYTTVYNCEHYTSGIAPMRGPDYVVEYRDRFTRVSDEWLIAVRDTTIVLRSDFAAGLPGIPNPVKT